MSNSPIIGNLVFKMHTSEANIGVNGCEAACAFISDLQSNPRPLTKFSLNISGMICLMLEILT